MEPLSYNKNEEHFWFKSIDNYVSCYQRYYQLFNTVQELEGELKREDINTVCKRELNDLRKNVPLVRYKEIIAPSNNEFDIFSNYFY